MHPMSPTEGQVTDLALIAARSSQSVALELVDRLARGGPKDRPRLLGRLWTLQIDVATRLYDDEPNEVVDRAWATVERFTALHRQFVQRMFEAIDTREAPAHVGPLAQVTRITARSRA